MLLYVLTRLHPKLPHHIKAGIIPKFFYSTEFGPKGRVLDPDGFYQDPVGFTQTGSSDLRYKTGSASVFREKKDPDPTSEIKTESDPTLAKKLVPDPK